MNLGDKIFVAGGAGMVGSAIVRKLLDLGFNNIIASYHDRQPWPTGHRAGVRYMQVDLTRQFDTERFFDLIRPDHVFLAAAKVGGILANSTYPGEFIYRNMAIATNTIHASYAYNVKRLLNIGSSCIYPKYAPQPIREEYLLSGPLEPTNEAYAIAKIAAIKMCRYYNEQYHTDFQSVMPTNLYGPNDNYDLQTSHVIPAMIRKFHLARLLEEGRCDLVRKDMFRWGSPPVADIAGGVDENSSDEDTLGSLRHLGISNPGDLGPGSPRDPASRSTGTSVVVRLWGTGTPRREFLHVDDLAAACVLLMDPDHHPPPGEFVNIGTGRDIPLQTLARLIADIAGFRGVIAWDHAMPDGTPEKVLDISRITALGWKPGIELREGLVRTYEWYRRASAHPSRPLP